MQNIIKKTIIIGLAMLALVGVCQGQTYTNSVTLAWIPSVVTSGAITNYTAYYGIQSRGYTNIVNAGTNLTVQVKSLASGTTYFYAVTATDLRGLTSAYSTEISYTNSGIPPGWIAPNPPTNIKASSP